MQLVEPLTKLQLLEDIKEETGSDSSEVENKQDIITVTRSQKHTPHMHTHANTQQHD